MIASRALICWILPLAVLAAGCTSGGGDQPSAAGADSSPSVLAQTVEGLIQAAGDNEQLAILAVWIAADRGYTVSQISVAARDGNFDADAGAVTSDSGYERPDGAPRGFVTDAPVLTSDGPVESSRFVEEDTGSLLSLAGAFLETPPEQVIASLDSSEAAAQAAEPPDSDASANAPRQTNFEGHYMATIMVLLDNGYSVEQIINSIVLGTWPDCNPRLPFDCGYPDLTPEVEAEDFFASEDEAAEDEDLEAVEEEGQSSAASEPTSWKGTVQPSGSKVENPKVKYSPLEYTVERSGEQFTLSWSYSIVNLYSSCTQTREHSFTGTGTRERLSDDIQKIGIVGDRIIRTSGCPNVDPEKVTQITNDIVQSDGVYKTDAMFVWDITFS